MTNFKNKVAWITGASSGIGKATALALAAQGSKIIISSENIEQLNEALEECKRIQPDSIAIPFDLSDEASIQQAFDQAIKTFDRIDILYNNGGISQRSLAHETPLEVDRKIMEINFFGGVSLTKKVLPVMLKQGSGHIAATSSISGKFGFHLRSAYAASKHAIQGFYETLGIELEKKNIRVTVVIPGRINTTLSLSALDKDGNPHGKMDDGQANGISTEKCAATIVKALKKNKREVLVGGKELLMVYIRRFFPKLFFKIVGRIKPT